MAEVVQTTADGTKTTVKPERNVRWAIWVVITILPLQLASQWWVLHSLTPTRWCAAQTTAAIQAKITPPNCEATLGLILDIFKVAVIGYNISIVISVITIVVMLMGAGLNLTVPWGKLGIGAGVPPQGGE